MKAIREKENNWDITSEKDEWVFSCEKCGKEVLIKIKENEFEKVLSKFQRQTNSHIYMAIPLYETWICYEKKPCECGGKFIATGLNKPTIQCLSNTSEKVKRADDPKSDGYWGKKYLDKARETGDQGYIEKALEFYDEGNNKKPY